MQDILEELIQEEISIPKMDVVKLNVTDVAIADLKKRYMPLKINGIEDREGLRVVYAARQDVKKTRVAATKYADGLKAKAIEWQNKVNTEKKRVIGELESIENHLQSEEDKIEALKEEIRQQEIRARKAQLQVRIDKLAEYNFKLEDVATLEMIDEETFDIVLNNALVQHEKDLAEKAEAERLAKVEADRLIAERKELEELRAKHAEAQKIIDDQNEKIRLEQERQEAAKKELARQKVLSRCTVLVNLGMKLKAFPTTAYVFEDVTISEEQLTLPDADWNDLIETTTVQIADRKAATELRLENERKESIRLFEVAKKDAADKAIRDKEAADLLAKQEAEERVAAASDKVKFKTVIKQLQAIAIPEMKSKKSKDLSKVVIENITALINRINSTF